MRTMPLHLLFPGIEVLSAAGDFTPVGQRRSGRPVVLLPREMCAFERFEPADRDGVAATRRRAVQAAPFLNSGSMVRRQGGGFAIWWWDLDRTASALRGRFGATPPPLLPMAMAQPPGEGWRMVRLEAGYDAQFWRKGALIASAWRPTPFDRKAWSMFNRLQRQAGAPIDPPAPVVLPVSVARVRAALAPELTAGEAAGFAAAAAGCAMAVTAAWAFGQGLRYEGMAREAAAAAPAVAAAAGRRGDAERLRAWRDLARRPDPVAALTLALGVAEAHGARPLDYAVGSGEVRLTLPYGAIASLDRIAAELRGSGRFSRVRTETDGQGRSIDLVATLAGADPSPAG